jgi:hypothetical protein
MIGRYQRLIARGPTAKCFTNGITVTVTVSRIKGK